MEKITFVRRQDIPFGGAENYLKRLINELKHREIEIELLHFSQPKWMPSWLKMPFYNLQACKNKKNRFYFSNDRVTCLDIHRAGGGVHKAFLRTKGFTLNPLHLVYIYLEKRVFLNSKIIIANSKLVKNDIIKYYNINPRKIELIYNGVEIPSIEIKDKKKYKIDLLKEFRLREERDIILYVGSGFKRKGVLELIEILSRIKKPFWAFIIGKEKNIFKYKKLVKKLSLEDKVIFTGPRKDVNRFYLAGDIFLFPTHYEPFPNVVLEAMSFYNVIITTKQCGAGEILEDVPIMENPKDYEIVNFIDKILEDRSQLNDLKIKNRKIAENFSIQNNVDKTIKLIERVQNENFSN